MEYAVRTFARINCAAKAFQLAKRTSGLLSILKCRVLQWHLSPMRRDA
jgi:hypothetical protein